MYQRAYIPGFNNRYIATTTGHIYSVIFPKIVRLKPAPTKSGHEYINMTPQKNAKRTKWAVHRAILTTFVGPRPPGKQCRHLDGNPANNNLSNLTWGTAKENSADTARHGHKSYGEKHGKAVLTEDLVKELRSKYVPGFYGAKSLAKIYGLHAPTVKDALTRRTWKHI